MNEKITTAFQNSEDLEGESLSALLDAAATPVYGESAAVDERRQKCEEAHIKIVEFLLSRSGSVYELFRSMRHYSAEGVADVVVMNEVYRMVHRRFIELSHRSDLTEKEKTVGYNCAQVLNEFVATAKDVLTSTQVPGDVNYLSHTHIENFSYKVGITEDAHLNQDNFLPFEIEKGRLAVFSDDGTRLYVVDVEASAGLIPQLDRAAAGITYCEAGQFFARFVDQDVPDELYEIVNECIDSGNALDMRKDLTGGDVNDLRDYIALLRSDVRLVIESDFGITLNQLSIREQFYFLNYLKHTTVATAETMKEFVANYGLAGLRSFLANAYDEAASENIMVFGVMADSQAAKEMFEAYAKSIDGGSLFVSSFQRWVEDQGDHTELGTLFGEVEEALVRRAGHLFKAGKEMALSEYSGEETVSDLIDAYEGVALMQEILASIGATNSDYSFVGSVEEGKGNAEGVKIFKIQITKLSTEPPEEYGLKISIRPRRNDKGEARINFELNFDSLPEDNPLRRAFHQEVRFFGSDRGRMRTVNSSALRFAFDLDTHDNQPSFSFDMGSAQYPSPGQQPDSGNTFERDGETLGNILAKVAPTGHHLTTFSSKLSNPETFATLADTFIGYFEHTLRSETSATGQE